MRWTKTFPILFLVVTLIFGCQSEPTHPDFSSQMSNASVTVTILDLGSAKGMRSDTALHGANGLAMKDDGSLLVGSLFGREITELRTSDGAILSRLGPTEGVEGTGDLCYCSDGSLLWTNFWTGEVLRRALDGALTSVFVGEGVASLAIAEDGTIYAARRFLGTGVYRLDPMLSTSPELIADPGDVGGLALDFRDRLHASLWTQGVIIRIDTVSPTPAFAVMAEDFEVPAGIAFDAEGKLLVAEHMTGSIWRVTLPHVGVNHYDIHQLENSGAKSITSHDRDLVVELGPGLDDLIVESRGHIFVANSQDGTVTKVYSTGTVRNLVEPGMILPGGVSIHEAPDGSIPLWVADAWTLRSFDRDTGDLLDVHRCMMSVNGFTAPMTVALSDESLIVSSWLGSVQVIDPVACQILETHDFDTSVEIPLNSIKFGDGIVVAGLLSGSVFNAADKSVIADGFVTPAGLASHEGNLWVADRSTGIVWQIAAEGVALPSPIQVAEGLLEPEGLAYLDPQHLLVVETGAEQLTRINSWSGTKAVLAEGLEVGLEGAPGQPTTWQFNGVTLGPDGTIYVTSDISNCVYEIRLDPGGEHYDIADGGTIVD